VRAVKIGVPREIKNHEYRVAITPSGVHELVRAGHDVFIEGTAGEGLNTHDGSVTNQPVAQAHEMPFAELAGVLA